ncbi:MAG: hypothetical protein ACR2G4_04535 [Pyrinomonadaceae bacterium]
MPEQMNSGQTEKQETPASGLLLSVEPLHGGAQLHAIGTADTDASDDTATDADKSDESDAKGADTDLTDTLGVDADSSDDNADTDSSDASIKMDTADA